MNRGRRRSTSARASTRPRAKRDRRCPGMPTSSCSGARRRATPAKVARASQTSTSRRETSSREVATDETPRRTSAGSTSSSQEGEFHDSLLTRIHCAPRLGAALMVTGLASATWVSAQKIDTIGGNSAELNTPSLDGCPIQSPDGLSLYIASNRPGGKGGLDIWMATPGEHERAVGCSAEPRRARQLGRGRLLSDPGRQERAVLREQGGAAGSLRAGRHLLHAPQRERAPGPSRSGFSAPRQARTRSSTSRAVVGRPRAASSGGRRPSTSRAAPPRRASPGEIFVSERQNGARFGPATAVAELNDATANDIQPNVRADGLEVVFTLEPVGDARRSGHLGRDAGDARRSVVGPGQPRRRREHGRGRDEAVALARRQAAPLRARTRPRGQQRHLRDDAAVAG